MKWRLLSYLLVGAGALVLLAPLASRGPAAATPQPEQQPAQAKPPAPSQSYLLEIPDLGARSIITEGIEDENLDLGPGHYPKTPWPGEGGNSAIAGHRTKSGVPSFFYNLHRLKAGSLIHVTTPSNGVLTYTVERVFITGPYDLSVLAPTPYPALTLTTCDPPGTDDKRLIVQARLTQPENPR